MNDLEFETRVFSSPDNLDREILDALEKRPELHNFVHQAQALEAQLRSTANSVEPQPGLKDKLFALSLEHHSEGSISSLSAASAEKSETARPKLHYFAMAASLVVAVAVLFLFNSNSPSTMSPSTMSPSTMSPTEIAFTNAVLEHILYDTEGFEAVDAGREVSYQLANSVLANAGIQIPEDHSMGDASFNMATPCTILEAHQSAHLVVAGTHGAVSFIVINNEPIARELAIGDERFAGVIIPSEEGNLVLVGEKAENLEPFKTMFFDNMEWVPQAIAIR